jgi:flagellar FliJ protein
MTKFRLEAVLKFRKHREESRKRELAKAVAEELQRKEKVLRLAELRKHESATLKVSQKPGPLDMQMVIEQRRYVGQLDREIYLRLSDVAKAEEVTAGYRKNVVEAMKDRKALDILKERFLLAAQQKAAGREAVVLDEVGLMLYRRGQKAGV